jgi:nuclear transport factor 2 (NTF2) superfamily protein
VLEVKWVKSYKFLRLSVVPSFMKDNWIQKVKIIAEAWASRLNVGRIADDFVLKNKKRLLRNRKK